jgi:bifunctional N-acetylglucosamine-1-phosphate-uridyltransferase/glucosamine-1-phosphate-acetyltransferase GlmU-like protein
MSSDLYVVCAGKGSRMAMNTPKALVEITDEPCLTTTLKQIGHKFAKVFIITNEMIQDQWSAYFVQLNAKYPELSANVSNIAICSGLGDGHAVMWGLAPFSNRSNDIVIAWGDVFFQHAEIIDELLSQNMDLVSGLLPCTRENDPYVSLLTDDNMNCMSADFSKYGEKHQTGFHDQSVFRFKKDILQESLTALHSAFWKNGRYISPGGELSLLHTFHHLYNNDKPAKVYETDYPTLSFNTLAEVAAIQKQIDISWNYKFRNGDNND